MWSSRERDQKNALVKIRNQSLAAKVEQDVDRLRQEVNEQIKDKAELLNWQVWRNTADYFSKRESRSLSLPGTLANVHHRPMLRASEVRAAKKSKQPDTSKNKSKEDKELKARIDELKERVALRMETANRVREDASAQAERADVVREDDGRASEGGSKVLRVLPWFRETHLRHAVLYEIVDALYERQQRATSEPTQPDSPLASHRKVTPLHSRKQPLFVSTAYSEGEKAAIKAAFDTEPRFEIHFEGCKATDDDVRFPALVLLTPSLQNNMDLLQHTVQILTAAQKAIQNTDSSQTSRRHESLSIDAHEKLKGDSDGPASDKQVTFSLDTSGGAAGSESQGTTLPPKRGSLRRLNIIALSRLAMQIGKKSRRRSSASSASSVSRSSLGLAQCSGLLVPLYAPLSEPNDNDFDFGAYLRLLENKEVNGSALEVDIGKVLFQKWPAETWLQAVAARHAFEMWEKGECELKNLQKKGKSDAYSKLMEASAMVKCMAEENSAMVKRMAKEKSHPAGEARLGLISGFV